MYKLLKVALIICGGMYTAIVCASAQSGEQTANGKPAVTVTVAKSGTTTAIAATTIDELLGLLPASDVIAVIDVRRAFNVLLPRLAALNIGEVNKMIKEIQLFTGKTGIDLSKAKSAALGFRVNGKQADGAAIISGLDVDEKKIETAMKAYSVNTDGTAFASLGQQKIVLGDLSAVKSVIDIQTGAAKGGVSPAMVAALKETRESALVRFAFNFPDNLRQEISNLNDLFKSVASIKMILGTLDIASDLSISLDTILRTESQNEAADLESGLKGLMSLIRGNLSGGDPKLEFFGRLLDLLKIGSKQNDVSLTITLPLSALRRGIDESTRRHRSDTRNPALTSPVYGIDIRFTAGKSALAIPFELDENNSIRLRVSVNDSPPLSFNLDTGDSANYPTLSVRAAESLGMKLQRLGKIDAGVGVKLTDFHIITDKASFSFPGVVLSSRSLFAISTDNLNECYDQATNGGRDRNIPSGQRVKEGTGMVMDGTFGKGFFSSFVVEIDYAARLINLYDPQSYKYTGRGKSFPLEMDSKYIYVRAQVKAPGRPPVTARLVVDTGGGAALTLNKQFAEEHKLLPPAEKLKATNECGVGGWAEGTSYEGELEALQLGAIKLPNTLTFFRKNPVGQGYDGLLGGATLRKFKVIFDYSRSRMILEPPR